MNIPERQPLIFSAGFYCNQCGAKIKVCRVANCTHIKKCKTQSDGENLEYPSPNNLFK